MTLIRVRTAIHCRACICAIYTRPSPPRRAIPTFSSSALPRRSCSRCTFRPTPAGRPRCSTPKRARTAFSILFFKPPTTAAASSRPTISATGPSYPTRSPATHTPPSPTPCPSFLTTARSTACSASRCSKATCARSCRAASCKMTAAAPTSLPLQTVCRGTASPPHPSSPTLPARTPRSRTRARCFLSSPPTAAATAC